MQNITNEQKSELKVRQNIEAFWFDKEGRLVKKDRVKNVVVSAALTKLLQRAAQETSDDCYINKAALGDGATTGGNTPGTGNTQLANEVYRNDVIAITGSAMTLYIDALFTQGEVSGTFTEFGFFMDGDAGANTGDLWNRVAVAWTKSSTESLFIRATFSIVNA